MKKKMLMMLAGLFLIAGVAAVTASADTRLAAPAEVAAPVVETTAQPAAVPGNSAASLITFGVLFLAATGFALYKAI